MFYGTYEGFEGFDVAEFNTREELDSWLRCEDRFSKEFGNLFPRKEYKNKRMIKMLLENPRVLHTTDLDGIHWLLYRPV